MHRGITRNLSLLTATVALAVSACGCGVLPPGDAAAPTSASQTVPRPPPESERVYTLRMDGPASGTFRTEDDTDSRLARSIRRSHPGAAGDPCLERAAAAYARSTRSSGSDLPLGFTEFVLHWAGCPDPTAAVSTLRTDDGSNSAVDHHLVEVLAKQDFTHFGAARVEDEAFSWRWVIFLVDRSFRMQEAPSSVEKGRTLPLMFKLDSGYSEATIYVTRPRGRIEEFSVGLGSGWAVASVPMTFETGRHWIELLAIGRSGPEVVALFPVEVDREPAPLWVGKGHASEAWIGTMKQAETYALELVNRDRELHGRAPMVWNDTLAKIARAHSADMASSDFFAHVSPTTGDISNRLRAHGYFTDLAMENLARSPTVAEAQEGLMRSPGHRAAILSAEATEIGIGVVRQEVGGADPAFLVTQIFAKPFTPIGSAELAAAMERSITTRRSSRGMLTAFSPAVRLIAVEYAASILADPEQLEKDKAAVNARLKRIDATFRGWQAVAGTARSSEDVTLPELVDDPEVRTFGIGVAGSGNSAAAYVILAVY